MLAGEQRHSLASSPKCPQKQGFIAASKIKRAGKLRVIFVRDKVTTFPSNGCRNCSITLRRNSGRSSKKRTPLCPKLTSPGFGVPDPPPNKPASHIER